MSEIQSGNQAVTLGGGCFWCLEAVYLNVRGVEKVESGYAGGEVANPSYEAVCTGRTGHAEVVQVTYDPNWRATSGSQACPVVKDVLGQTRILAPPGQHHIELYWETPLENQIGRGLFAMAILLCGWLFWRGRRR